MVRRSARGKKFRAKFPIFSRVCTTAWKRPEMCANLFCDNFAHCASIMDGVGLTPHILPTFGPVQRADAEWHHRAPRSSRHQIFFPHMRQLGRSGDRARRPGKKIKMGVRCRDFAAGGQNAPFSAGPTYPTVLFFGNFFPAECLTIA